MNHLHLDFETFSSVDIRSSGAYKYTESLDFEILMMAYSFNDEPEQIIDLARGESIPMRILEAWTDPDTLLFAHNATFERLCLRAYGVIIPPERWRCSQVKAAYCGLPQPLADLSKALNLGEDAKDAKGKALIQYFSVLVKPTKANGYRRRNLPHHNPEKWEDFKRYCIKDVQAEKAVLKRLEAYEIPEFEQRLYNLDQRINDRGIKIDSAFAQRAVDINNRILGEIIRDLKKLTNLENPNSLPQLKSWLSLEMKKTIKSLSKDDIPILLKEAGAGSIAGKVLALRLKGSKTSVKKYVAMLCCLCDDGKAHGLFQFYGAGRTGRWAGRLIQLQNLPKNFMKDLEFAKKLVRDGKFDALQMIYDSIADTLSQLIRTAFVPTEGKIFGVADFKAIEARVIAWLAGEAWRLDVFNSTGFIYEASAGMMFSVDPDTIQRLENGKEVKGENYYLRARGKVAELALGYQGGVGALIQMGAEEMGLSNKEMKYIVSKWREANPNIVELWKDIEKCAILAIKTGKTKLSKFKGISFSYDGTVLQIGLPSGRKLIYQSPRIVEEVKWEHLRKDPDTGEQESVWIPLSQKRPTDIGTGKTWTVQKLTYMGMNQTKKIWCRIDSYGGKLVENIVQAIARDILAVSMVKLDSRGFDIVMHVHDESVADLERETAEERLEEMCQIMGEPIEWAEGLPLAADGYLTEFYKKD